MTPQLLAPFTSDLLARLFATLTLPGSTENEYVMKGKRKTEKITIIFRYSYISFQLLCEVFIPCKRVLCLIWKWLYPDSQEY